MSERFYHTLDIGGDPGENRGLLMAMLCNEMLNTEFTEPEIGQHLSISCCESPSDHLDGLKDVLKEWGLSYDHYTSPSDGLSEVQCWRPGFEDESIHVLIEGFGPVLGVDDLQWEIENNPGITVQEIINKWTPPELPDFVCSNEGDR